MNEHVDMPNLYQAVAVFKAVNRIGTITTFLNPFQSDDELKDYIKLYKSSILFNYDRTDEYNKKLLNDTGLKHIVTLSH